MSIDGPITVPRVVATAGGTEGGDSSGGAVRVS